MTYRELKNWLDGFSDDELDGIDVTVYLSGKDEFYGVKSAGITGNEPDVLDPHHPFLIVDCH